MNLTTIKCDITLASKIPGFYGCKLANTMKRCNWNGKKQCSIFSYYCISLKLRHNISFCAAKRIKLKVNEARRGTDHTSHFPVPEGLTPYHHICLMAWKRVFYLFNRLKLPLHLHLLREYYCDRILVLHSNSYKSVRVLYIPQEDKIGDTINSEHRVLYNKCFHSYSWMTYQILYITEAKFYGPFIYIISWSCSSYESLYLHQADKILTHIP